MKTNKDRTLYKHRDHDGEGGWWDLRIEENNVQSLLFKVADFAGPEANLYFADEEQVRQIRDALTKWLGDE